MSKKIIHILLLGLIFGSGIAWLRIGDVFWGLIVLTVWFYFMAHEINQ